MSFLTKLVITVSLVVGLGACSSAPKSVEQKDSSMDEAISDMQSQDAVEAPSEEPAPVKKASSKSKKKKKSARKKAA